jgi:hypothetical protein
MAASIRSCTSRDCGGNEVDSPPGGGLSCADASSRNIALLMTQRNISPIGDH